MKKVPVLALIVVGLGAAAFAGPVSGTAEVCARFEKTDLVVFDAVVDLDYTISTTTFGATVVFELTDFDLLFFTAAGTLGPIGFRSMLAFDPQTTAYLSLIHI